ncbi:MAG: hypothetical protein R3F21_08350 [Myxococcota bacterium]
MTRPIPIGGRFVSVADGLPDSGGLAWSLRAGMRRLGGAVPFFLLLLLVTLRVAAPAFGEEVVVAGAAGPSGADGVPAEAGAAGGAGGAAVAEADSPTDAFNRSEARGGEGGDGGRGGAGPNVPTSPADPTFDGQPGGAGGVGGAADSTAIRGTSTATFSTASTAVAVGGAGGNGGAPGTASGSPPSASAGPTGLGGRGGDARAFLTDGPGSISSRGVADARGGDGGTGYVGGDGGTGHASVDVSEAAASLGLNANARGGAGGAASNEPGSQAGQGGLGLATGRITGGGTNARTLTLDAEGGRGGVAANVESAVGGRGGDARAEFEVEGRYATVNATADGGAGGEATGFGRTAGDGGTAVFVGTVSSTTAPGSFPRRDVVLTGTGGQGGLGIDGAMGGDGGDVDLGGIVIEAGTDSITFRQTAIGGRGGQSSSASGGIAGDGGDATSRIDEVSSAERLQIEGHATGGDAGTGRRLNATSRGGEANAIASGENATGTVDVRATATGGDGGGVVGYEGGSAGLSGNATAVATGTATAPGASVTTRAYAAGGEGGDSDGGSAGAGGRASAESTATARGNGSVSSEATASSGGAGRLARPTFNARATDGRVGADNVARASGTNAGTGTVNVTATAFGGAGSNAYGAGRRAGAGGIGTALATGHSQSGTVAVASNARGGDGGAGLSGASGGAGGDAFVQDSVTGSTSNLLRLVQAASGGHGGTGTGVGAEGGEGGDATSLLNAQNLAGGALRVEVSARAGAGGVGRTRREKSGDVRLGATATGARDVTIEAAVDIGPGSTLTLDPIHGRSTGGGNVFVRLQAEARAWAGRGLAGESGAGVDVALDNAVSGESDGGRTTLWQRALASSALEMTNGAMFAGGAASSRMSGDADGETVVNADAYGGEGASEPYFVSVPPTARTGRGGDATTSVDYTTSDGDLVVHAGARAGSGGSSFAPRPGGAGGDAVVSTNVVVGIDATKGATIGGPVPTRFDDPQVGAHGGRGGADGDGGDATSASRMTSNAVANHERHQVTDRAVGGDGGTQGGDGGDASSFAEILAVGDESISVLSEAIGGGGVRGGAATARAHGESPTGDVFVLASQIAGDGLEVDAASASAAGRDSTMSNAATGSTAGRLELMQTSVAGSGSSRDRISGGGGDGGHAASILTQGNTGGGTLIADVSATGGDGGRAVGAGFTAGAGGDAVATVVLGELMRDVTIDLEAIGGNGGLSAGGAGVGRGGSAGFGESRLSATSDQTLRVGALARSGDGGSRDPFQGVAPMHGGDAQDVVLENAVLLQTLGQVVYTQQAIGGHGGEGVETGGAGGHARSVIRRIETGSFIEQLTASARGGTGGSARSGLSGRAGDAHAEIEARSSTASLTLVATATSGGTTLPTNGGAQVRAGDATTDVSGTVDGHGLGLTIGDFAIGGTGFGARGAAGASWLDSGSPVSAIDEAGRGGNATSRSVGLALGDSRVIVRDRAIGGEGGRSNAPTAVRAGEGGDASSIATARGEGASRVEASAEAIGGLGGSSGNARAVGGTARAEASGISTQGGDVAVVARQTGGTLRDSRMIDQVSGSTSGALVLTQISTGGHGGGTASSNLTSANGAGGALTMHVEAIGGTGDRTRDLAGIASTFAQGRDVSGASLDVRSIATAGNAFQAGNGGAASAVTDADGLGRVIAHAQSNAGIGQGAVGVDGASLATATAVGVDLASARADMTRRGQHDGTADATLRPGFGPIESAQARLRTLGESQAAVNMQSDVFVRGHEPGPAAPAGWLDGTIAVEVAAPEDGGPIADVDIVLSSESGASDWSQEAMVELTLSEFASPLSLVFDEWTGTDAGLESIAIAISWGDRTIVDETFAEVGLALAFLSGRELLLGSGSGVLSTSIRLESSAAGSVIRGGLALIVVPEPSTALLLILGLSVLAARNPGLCGRRYAERGTAQGNPPLAFDRSELRDELSGQPCSL